ncbi:unnamed protein product [Calypogeia fissa]
MWPRGSDYKRVPQGSQGSAGSTMDIPKPAPRKPSMSLLSTMRVTQSPAPGLALTNLAYCSGNDIAHFVDGQGLQEGMVLIKNQIVLTILYPFHQVVSV